MTPLETALALARQIDQAAAIDATRALPRHEDLYHEIADLAGGLTRDLATGQNDTLADILPAHCQRAAEKVWNDSLDEQTSHNGGMSFWLEDAMDEASAEAAVEWAAEARKLAGPMLAEPVRPRRARPAQDERLAA